MIEQTLVLLKPDAVQRGLAGKIIDRFEQRGLKIVGMKMVWVDKKFAEKHYPRKLIPIIGSKTIKDWEEMGIRADKSADELGEKAWHDLLTFTTESPVVAIALEGVHAVQVVRAMVGPTSPHKAAPGTIRGDFTPISMGYATLKGFGGRNLVHASGSPEEAKEEIKLWFAPHELHKYRTVHERHVAGE